MKNQILIFATILLGTTAFAERQSSIIEWKSDILPLEVQQYVEAAVESRCDIYGSGLKEYAVLSRTKKINQEKTESEFYISLSTQVEVDGKMVDQGDAIVINLTKSDVSNPDARSLIQIENLVGRIGVECK